VISLAIELGAALPSRGIPPAYISGTHRIRGAPMRYESIVEILDYATGHERQVRITTTDNQQVIGIPTSVDREQGAIEVFLHPAGASDVEIAVSLAHIRDVEIA
jgi:hypothetical protein